jgi:hypothetical protein
MASPVEIKLGRLVVDRGLCTQEQVIVALKERNADPEGPTLGARLVAKGFFSDYVLKELERVVETGVDGRPARGRHEASTERNIHLGSAREAIARECLNEARAQLDLDRDAALREIRRLAEEFQDRESGVAASELLRELGA